MGALIKKDLILAFGNRQMYFLLLYPLLLLFILGLEQTGVILLGSIMSLSFLLTITSFAYEEKSGPRYFLHSLPIKRWEIIFSKYLSVLVYFTLSLLYTYFYGWILELFGVKALAFFDLSLIQNALILTLSSLSLALPLFYLLPPKIARFAYIFIFILLTNFLVLEKDVDIIGQIPYPFLVGLLYLISLGVSMAIYKYKDID